MKKWIALLLALLMVLPLGACKQKSDDPKLAAESYDQSGTCGEDVRWEFNGATGELTITGTGEMDNYENDCDESGWYSTAPWGELDVKAVTIHGVTSIGDCAFFFCDSMTEVTMDDSVTSIGVRAFRNCDSLTSITMGDGVTTIGALSFSFCDNLTEVTMGNSVTIIEYSAFRECNNLTDVYYGGTEEQWNSMRIKTMNEPLTEATIHFES